MSKTTHAKHSPSSLDSLSRCIRFKYLEFEDEDAANEGTMLHEAFETGNLAGLDDEQTRCVQAILDLVSSYKATEGGPDCWIEYTECKIGLQDLTFGTMDRALVHKTKPIAIVLDAKFTRRRSEHDMQLNTYAAGLVETLALDPENPRQLDQVTTVIAAPRIGAPEVEIHNAQMLLTEVRKWITDLYAKIDDPFNEPTPHEDLCVKCARASRCPALNAIVKQAGIQMGLPLPSVFDPGSMISIRDRAIGQVLAGALANWAEQVKKANTQFVVESGDPKAIDGFQLISRSTGARVSSEFTPLAIAAILASFDTTQDVILENSTIAIGKLAKRLAEDSGSTEAEMKEQLKEALSDIAQEGKAEYLGKTKRVADADMILKLT
jgi:hypothetical protein